MFKEPKMGGRDDSFTSIDRLSPEIARALDVAPVFKKLGSVKARHSKLGEVVVTILKNGKQETRNTAEEGDVVVTNPDGEEYLVPGKKFFSRYKESDIPGVYLATGYVRAIVNPFGKPIEIISRDGDARRGDERCLLADVCDEHGERSGNPYIIAAREFSKTYEKVEL